MFSRYWQYWCCWLQGAGGRGRSAGVQDRPRGRLHPRLEKWHQGHLRRGPAGISGAYATKNIQLAGAMYYGACGVAHLLGFGLAESAVGGLQMVIWHTQFSRCSGDNKMMKRIRKWSPGRLITQLSISHPFVHCCQFAVRCCAGKQWLHYNKH